MNVFVRFHDATRWHVVDTNRWEWMLPVGADIEVTSEGEYVPTMCDHDPYDDRRFQLRYPVTTPPPSPVCAVCARCEERN